MTWLPVSYTVPNVYVLNFTLLTRRTMVRSGFHSSASSDLESRDMQKQYPGSHSRCSCDSLRSTGPVPPHLDDHDHNDLSSQACYLREICPEIGF